MEGGGRERGGNKSVKKKEIKRSVGGKKNMKINGENVFYMLFILCKYVYVLFIFIFCLFDLFVCNLL